MEMTLSMQHYGRGVAGIPMPRAISRGPRKEWPVNPSLIIFILAVLLILLLKLTTTSTQKLLKPTKTIIIIPQVQPAPEPTVPKSIPLIKVIKDAVKKTVVSKKKELKKVIPKKVEPKKPLAPKIKPKKTKPLPRLDKKIEAKKIIPKPLAKKTIEAKPVTQKKIHAAKPINKAIPEKRITQKKIDTKALTPKTVPIQKSPGQHIPKPTVNPNSRGFTPKPMARAQSKLPERIPVSSFSAIQGLERKSVVNLPTGQSGPRSPVKLDSARSGPAPELTQLQSYKPKVAASPAPSAGSSPARKVAALDVPAPAHHVGPTSSGPAAEDLVIINSSSIGNSDRVKTLKRDIMKKAGKMNPARSPYRYKIKNYTCTLTVEGGAQGKIIIDFTPADAPFDVVSALERQLPR